MAYKEGEKVLVVEDDGDILFLYKMKLEGIGLFGAAASSAKLAIEQMNTHDFGLIVMDSLDGDFGQIVDSALNHNYPLSKLILLSGSREMLQIGQKMGIRVEHKLLTSDFKELIR